MSIKSLARRITAQAIKSGKLKRPDKCSECNKETTIHAHHPNYKKPLKIMWLCPKCHKNWHKKHGFQNGVGGSFVIDMDEETFHNLRIISKKNHRSVSGQTRWIIKEWLEKNK